jgi:hypothetical protein
MTQNEITEKAEYLMIFGLVMGALEDLGYNTPEDIRSHVQNQAWWGPRQWRSLEAELTLEDAKLTLKATIKDGKVNVTSPNPGIEITIHDPNFHTKIAECVFEFHLDALKNQIDKIRKQADRKIKKLSKRVRTLTTHAMFLERYGHGRKED